MTSYMPILMHTLTRYLTLVIALCLVTASVALADKDDDDKEKKRRAATSQMNKIGALPDPGDCQTGLAQKDLDVNNVRARLFNFGSIAYGNGAEAQYVVPKASGHSPIYASGVWIGGQVGGELRTAGATYTNFEFWPGPLGPDGRPVNPNNCSQYDRLFKVSRSDIQNYEATGQASADLADWPVDLGAPVIDGDGTEGNYNLAGGDRPELIGDQAVWWIMNDVGNAHNNTQAPPIGVEVRVHAFAFNRADALGNTTFFKYNITYKGDEPLEDTYLSIFSDPDLGSAGDDYVGVDTSLSLGYVYNATATDAVYGPAPAAGYDFFQGPVSVEGDTLGVTSFMYFINGGPEGTEDPHLSQEIYNVQQGRWRGGQPLTASGLGYQTDGPITKFAYPGDPVTGSYWSEVNNDGNGAANQAGDRRLVMSTGPFTLQPGESQDIVFGVVFAQGSDNLSSISALRAADILAQAAYDADFDIPTPPPAPPRCQPNSTNEQLQPGSGSCLYASEIDGEAALVWGYPTNSNNYLGSYDLFDPFLANLGLDDTTYTFEGFNIYRYPTSSFAADQREHVATFDIANGVMQVNDPVFDPDVGEFINQVSARGTDSGLQYHFPLPNLTNYTDYYYGISAYAYSPNSTPKVLESSPTNITVRPADIAAKGLEVRTETFSDSLASPVSQSGQGVITYDVVDPVQVVDDSYTVRFFDLGEECGIEEAAGITSYDIVRESDGYKIIDGCAYYEETGAAVPQREDVIAADGLSFSVTGPPPSYATIPGSTAPAFLEMQAPGGGDACEGSEVLGCPQLGGDLIQQSFNSTGEYVSYPMGAGSMSTIGAFSPNDFEIRFTEQGSYAYDAFDAGNVMWVPFEVWDIGPTATGSSAGVNDPSDDVQLIAAIFADHGGICEFNVDELTAEDDPFGLGLTGTDRIYAYYSATTYDQWAAEAEPLVEGDPDGCLVPPDESPIWNHAPDFGRGRPLQREVLWNTFEDVSELQGTVIRFITTKPNLPGDEFTISTAGLGVVADSEEALEEALDQIGIVPNPYRARSAYETGNQDRRVRFTNLPEQATIRIYTVSGTLIRTLHKDGPSPSIDWNLATESNLPVASGMYFIHVDVPGVGERVLKFGVVNRETNINIF